MSDWSGGTNPNLGPQFHMHGDGSFSPGYAFDSLPEFQTAPDQSSLEMPYSTDHTSARKQPGHVRDYHELRRVNPRIQARLDLTEQGNPMKKVTDERGRTSMGTNNSWGNRQNMN